MEFFHRIIEQTGLKPVFLGQLGENAYCRRLQTEFPEAKFIPSAGAIEDFNKLRMAKHLVMAVSTFSWLAAWLSKAEKIHVPMLGFLHPLHFGTPKIIDLLPSDDPRYVFHLFPLTYGIQNPSRYEDLRAFAEEMGSSHVTARGIDVIEKLSDCPLDMSQPILGIQRTRCI